MNETMQNTTSQPDPTGKWCRVKRAVIRASGLVIEPEALCYCEGTSSYNDGFTLRLAGTSNVRAHSVPRSNIFVLCADETNEAKS